MKNLNNLKKTNNNISVLYIEPNKKLQYKISNHLKQIFTTVYQSFTGLDAMDIYIDKKPNIVILDLALEQIDAVEFIINLKEIDDKANIIILSEDNENFQLLKTIDMGLCDMMLKPVNLHKLDFSLKKILSKIVPKTIEKPIVKDIQKPTIKKTIKTPIEKLPPEPTKKIVEKKPTIKKPIKNCFARLTASINQKIELLNTYKGIPIHNSGTIISCEQNLFNVIAPKAQLVSAQYEKFTILKLDNTTFIYAFILKIDLNTKTLTLVKPKFINYKNRTKLYNRVLVDKSFKASVFIGKILTEFNVKHISYLATALYTSNYDIDVKIGDKLDLTLGFDLNSPSSLIKEKKFTKIFTKASVFRIDKLKDGLNLVVSLDIQKAGQNTFKKYLQNREMEIIHEFKKRLRL